MTQALPLGCHSCHATPRNDRRRRLFALANRVQEQVARFSGAIEHVHGPQNVETSAHELVVLCIGRDAELWVPSFVEHHLALGAKHIFYLDNGSTDGTVDRLSRYRGVSVFRTELSFKRYEVGLRRWITHSFGRGRWSLYCDADELFDYPYSDRLTLPDFLRYLERYGYKTVTGQMLDLFSERSFTELHSAPEDDLRAKYRWYDLTDLVRVDDVYWIRDGMRSNQEIGCIFGGIRKRFFGDDCLLLTKHPLVFADDTVGVYTYDGHFMTDAPVADISTVLLHYKYVANLPQRVRAEVAGAWHNKVDALYGGLAEVLERNPDLSLRLDTARELGSVNELIDNGFLVVTDRYRTWVEQHERARTTA